MNITNKKNAGPWASALFGILSTFSTAGMATPMLLHHGDNPLLVGDGESMEIYSEHHTPGDGFHESHYFAMTGDAHHFAWGSVTPATPGPIVVGYDFRTPDPITGGANVITAAQKALAVTAFGMWSAATGGKLSFALDPVSPFASIINVATAFIDGPGGILGLGGGVFTHSGATHSITSGAATQDSAEAWDLIIGNGDPLGTFDYFTVITQEIGHALGLGHTDNTGMTNMMNGSYTGEQTALSTIDAAHICSVYGGFGTACITTVPEPGTLALLSVGFGLLGSGVLRRRRKVHA